MAIAKFGTWVIKWMVISFTKIAKVITTASIENLDIYDLI